MAGWLAGCVCMQVGGFEEAGETFIADMKAAGLTVTTADKAFES